MPGATAEVAAGSTADDGAFTVQVGDGAYRLHDGELVEAGDDYDYMRFRVTSVPVA